MAKIKDEFHKYLEDLDKNIKNEEDLLYVKNRTASFMNSVLDYVDYILKYKEDKILAIENIQTELEKKMNGLQKDIEEIQQDIYIGDMEDLEFEDIEELQQFKNYDKSHEEEYDTEIVCPYCENEILVDLSQELNEVQCPECNNIIELEWTGNVEETPEINNSCNHGKCSQCPGCRTLEEDDDDM